MKPTELVALLQECYRERLALVEPAPGGRTSTSATSISTTPTSTSINREETHLAWLGAAIEELGGVLPANPAAHRRSTLDRRSDRLDCIREDARAAPAFRRDVEAARGAGLATRRHQSMLRVMLGETLEHKRLLRAGRRRT